MAAVLSLLGSEATPFSGSLLEEQALLLFDPLPFEREEPVMVRTRRVRRLTGELVYLVLKRGRRMGRQAERMPMLHSTFTQTPTLVEVHVMSERESSERRGMRTIPAMQTLTDMLDFPLVKRCNQRGGE